jgi:hypothetical protein
LPLLLHGPFMWITLAKKPAPRLSLVAIIWKRACIPCLLAQTMRDAIASRRIATHADVAVPATFPSTPLRALHPQTKPHCPGIRLGIRTAVSGSEYYELDPNTFCKLKNRILSFVPWEPNCLCKVEMHSVIVFELIHCLQKK